VTAGRFDRERFEELRAARALGELDAQERNELEALLAEQAGLDLEADELAAAAAELAQLDPARLEPLPAALAKKLEADGRAWLAQGARAAQPAAREPAPIRELRPKSGGGAWGWIAAAAALVLALIGWWPELRGTSMLSPSAGRDALVAKRSSNDEVLLVPWKGTDHARGAEGDVVWDAKEQRGFMRIRGLARNDPTQTQYQLWIFDETQTNPIDGGVFDIGADGELVIPIDAKLHVAKPTLFAVTVEKPGGVVVSAQEKIVLAGKV
jgi:anti-sigma-K factor RskA